MSDLKLGFWANAVGLSNYDTNKDNLISIQAAKLLSPGELSSLLINAISYGNNTEQLNSFMKDLYKVAPDLARNAMSDFSKCALVDPQRVELLNSFKGSDLYFEPKKYNMPKTDRAQISLLRLDKFRPAIKDVSMRLKNTNWWEKGLNDPKIRAKNPQVPYRLTQTELAPVTMLSQIVNKSPVDSGLSNNVTFGDVPGDYYPVGRPGDGMKRDAMFYNHAKESLQPFTNTKGTVFINYTGHEGPVAAALAEHNIPLAWQISTPNERVIQQIQDYHRELGANNSSNDSNLGIILEPNHGGNTINLSNLPSLEYLRQRGLTEVVILSEDIYGTSNTLGSVKYPDSNFQDYLKGLESNGIKVKIIGLDVKEGIY